MDPTAPQPPSAPQPGTPPPAAQPQAAPAAQPQQAAPATHGPAWKCPTCGGALAWNPTKGQLGCASCGAVVSVAAAGAVSRHTFPATAVPPTTAGNDVNLPCGSCGAPSVIPAADLSGRCKYCSWPWVVVDQHASTLKPDGVVPASVDISTAQAAVRKWVASRWFAPSDFKSGAAQPTITLAYHPMWAFAAATESSFSGERGTHYYTTERTRDAEGHEVTTEVQHTRWDPVSGTTSHIFDDVGVAAGDDVPKGEEWVLSEARGYADAYLVGSVAHAATVSVSTAWMSAVATMSSAIENDARRIIGGDEQRVESVNTNYSDTNVRYLLAPSWSGNYTYKQKAYVIEINGETGAVKGTRPYSAIKIGLAVLLALVVIAAIITVLTITHSHSSSTSLLEPLHTTLALLTGSA